MILTSGAKRIADALRQNASVVRPALRSAFETAIVGCRREEDFFSPLIRTLKNNLNGLAISGIDFECRVGEIHAKPIVEAKNVKGLRCELGDLVTVVKYHPDDEPMEAKSIIYQVKFGESRKPTRCRIDQKQLTLLTSWPAFEFGRKKDGGRQTYDVSPLTLEFGSYMLEPRGPSRGETRSGRRGAYGISPNAWAVRSEGPTSVDLDGMSYVRSDSQALFSQIVFEIGEHQVRWPVHRLITALYRYVGLAPDPPAEFDEYSEETEEPGFALLEINVSETEE